MRNFMLDYGKKDQFNSILNNFKFFIQYNEFFYVLQNLRIKHKITSFLILTELQSKKYYLSKRSSIVSDYRTKKINRRRITNQINRHPLLRLFPQVDSLNIGSGTAHIYCNLRSWCGATSCQLWCLPDEKVWGEDGDWIDLLFYEYLYSLV